MQRHPLPARGFTLVELLIVVSIIMVLAGLTLPLFTYANVKAASDRARAEISALSLALESYKIDNGDYPRSSNYPALDDLVADKLIAQQSSDATISAGKYQAASLALYSALSGDTDLLGGVDSGADGTKNHIYFEFKQGMLYPKCVAGTARTTPINALIDPFRNVYGYSTAGSIATPVANQGYNPTFDLWSTADKDQSGGTPETTWIKNW